MKKVPAAACALRAHTRTIGVGTCVFSGRCDTSVVDYGEAEDYDELKDLRDDMFRSSMGAGSDSVELMHQMMDSTEDARRFLVRSTFYGGTSSPRITEQRRRAFEMGMSMTKTSIRMAREWRRLVEDGPRTRNTAALNLGVRGHLEDRLGGKTHGRPVDSGTSAALAPRDRQHWQQRPTLLMERLLALDEDVLREHFGQPVAPLPVASCAALAPAARTAAVPPPPV